MTLIIGEIGSNFESKQDIFDSITSLKECGADIAKLQLYSHKELYGYDGPVMPGEISREWIPEFAAHCDKIGIEFMCTAFSPEGYRFIDPYVKRHKIASAENCDPSILREVAKLGKPILISTGGSSLEELELSIGALIFAVESVTIMYCVSAYPAKNLDVIPALENLRYHFNYTVSLGYSCHTSDRITADYAWRYGRAMTIEKHFKIREMNTPDNPHSIVPSEFKEMVLRMRCADQHKRRPRETPFPHPDEADFVQYSKRRYIPELGGYYRTKKP